MMSKFRGYIPFADDEFEAIWRTAIFAFDTNVLLCPYRMSRATAEGFFKSLDHVKDRIWLPYQVGIEFFRHYHDEIQAQFSVYDKATKHFDKMVADFQQEFPRHPYLPLDDFKTQIAELTTRFKSQLQNTRQNHVDPTGNDATLSLYLDLFKTNVGPKPLNEELTKLYKEFDFRFERSIPPGFVDGRQKKDETKYGDCLIWYELISVAIEKKKPIIFVTDDRKEDWFQITHGRTLGPRPELIQEMFDKSQQHCYLYNLSNFVEYAGKHFKTTAQPEVIQEIREIEKEQRISDAVSNYLRLQILLQQPLLDLRHETTKSISICKDLHNELPNVIILNWLRQLNVAIEFRFDIDVMEVAKIRGEIVAWMSQFLDPLTFNRYSDKAMILRQLTSLIECLDAFRSAWNFDDDLDSSDSSSH